MSLAKALSFCDHMPAADLADFIKTVDTQPPPTVHYSSTRRVARYRTDIPVIVRVLVDDEYVAVQGRCFEIGEGGLGAVITREFPAGEMVLLELSFPQLPSLEPLRAVVRHRMGFLHGFEFLGLGPEQREVIRAYCRTQQPA
jgi:PilZ domain